MQEVARDKSTIKVRRTVSSPNSANRGGVGGKNQFWGGQRPCAVGAGLSEKTKSNKDKSNKNSNQGCNSDNNNSEQHDEANNDEPNRTKMDQKKEAHRATKKDDQI